MNHEKRIAQLEKEIAQLKELVKPLSKQKWLTLSQITEQFGVSRTVILNRIQNGLLVHLKDWKKNGNRYLINSHSIPKIQ